MLIKNAIVLVEEIDAQKTEEGLSQSDAIVAASISRLRPVLLAAVTTILGMVPLLADSFFAAMAVTIMGGLGFASVLTLIGVPALYHTYLAKERRADAAAKIMAARDNPYEDIPDLQKRARITAPIVRRLAEADAMRSMFIDRRQALWEAKALRDAPDLPLFQDTRDEGAEITVPLPVMPVCEQVVADYQTLRLSLIVTVLAAVLGYIPAYVIAMTKYRHKWLLLLLLILPFWISFIIRTLSWIHIFGNQGALNGLMNLLGLGDLPVQIMYTEFTVIVGFIHVFLPYMILNVYVSLEGIDKNLEPAARTLGATPWQAFKEVTLPLSLPGLAAGSLLVFVLTGGSYVTPLILGGPSDFLFGNLVYDAVVTELNWPMGATLSFTLLFLLGSVVILYSRLMGMNQLAKAFG